MAKWERNMERLLKIFTPWTPSEITNVTANFYPSEKKISRVEMLGLSKNIQVPSENASASLPPPPRPTSSLAACPSLLDFFFFFFSCTRQLDSRLPKEHLLTLVLQQESLLGT